MPGQGLQEIPLRVPDRWDPAWFTRFVREVLALADIRNAVEGTGVTITGNSSEPATIAADASIAGLLNVPFVTLALSSQLTAERVLTAGQGIGLTDAGAGSTITISVNDVPYSLLGELPPLSVLGNQLDSDAQPGAIVGINEHDVLSIQSDGIGGLFMQFGPITHESVSDFQDEVEAIILPRLPFMRGATFVSSVAIATPVNDVPLRIPVACTITSVTVLTLGGSGSCVIDIWKDTYANYPPTVADSICASAKPTVSGTIKSEDTTLTGWTVDVDAGDTLIFHLESSTTFTTIVVLLELQPV